MKNYDACLLEEEDDIPSPISGPIFDFADADLFSEALQNSEVTSSNCCYEESNSYGNNNTNNLTIVVPQDIENLNGYHDNNGNTPNSSATPNTATSTTTTASTNTTAATTAATNNNNLSIIFDSPDDIDNDISASIDFSQSPASFSVPNFLTQQDQFDLSLVQSQIQLSDGIPQYSAHHDPVGNLMGPPLSSVFDEDCLSSVPNSYHVPNLNPSSPSCSFLGSFMPPGALASALSGDHGNSGIFAFGNSHELQPQDLEFQGDNAGIFCADSLQRCFNPGDLQALSSESQQLVGATASSTPLASEISSLEDSSFNKVGKLSVEQRKEKIHRYMKKRNERNFSKKIKYACRKTLADSRPRVRGRFAKNDDFGETPRQASSNHEEDDDDEVVVKEEEDMVDSSDIFAHISGVNSFKCNYPIQSWI
ncbi:hypothetical protein CCACVL1_04474 [Corchorus capsularis]|uniref:CCT domain-containing protein n=1 Tax=Corchorus capsularis TaxID=210143 RepID=A0A1R3JS65_COCAP|nr:hypothetical protein CCACVL1_04474 [Corchorus capsularis]